jgi:putative phosphoesterase
MKAVVSGATMKVGIISDTHDNYGSTMRSVELFNEHAVNYVFHAGDIVSPAMAKAFAGLTDAKFIAVFGNCDCEKEYLRRCVEGFGGEIHEEDYSGQVGGKTVYMRHVPGMLDAVIYSEQYDLVIYGHTHEQDIRRIGQTLVINPGRSAGRLTGRSGVVVVELDDMSAEVVALK